MQFSLRSAVATPVLLVILMLLQPVAMISSTGDAVSLEERFPVLARDEGSNNSSGGPVSTLEVLATHQNPVNGHSYHLLEAGNRSLSSIVAQSLGGDLVSIDDSSENQWIVSTSRCIDATKAYWNSNKSFYELFIDCIGDYDLNQLDINKCYTFIILHPENRIVLNYLEPSCIHILTYDKTECKEVDDDINLPKPEECNFASFEDFINAVTDLDYTEPGYMLVDENNNRVRVMSRKYEEVRNLKGNIPNMAKRFLQLRKIEPEKIPIFLQYYPEYTELYNNLERHIIYICNVIFQKYKVRRRQHRRVELSQIESDIHYRVHGLYLGLRQASNLTNTNIIRSITLDDITIIVNSLPINKIYQLLQEYTIVLDESV